jgi:phage terminase large subunit-like protein
MKPEICPAATVEDAIEYARQVVSGKIVACVDVISQCRMFCNDYDVRQHDPEFRWEFDHDKAADILGYTQLLKFIDDDLAGSPMRLSDWQAFIFCNSHGWVDKQDDLIRRYTEVICQVARKNSKSTLLATLALYELMYAPDGSQIVSFATKREQAKIVWETGSKMIRSADKRLTNGVQITLSQISNKNNNNTFKALAKQSNSLDGLNVRCAIADESAAITDHNLFNVISSSMGAQKSPQFWHITTAQPSSQSNFYFEKLDYAKKVLNGIIPDERIFCMAYAIDDDDEWDDESVWVKANPNIGKSARLDHLQEACEKSKYMPSEKVDFLVKRLNRFISTASAWIELEAWNKNIIAELDTTMPLYVGLDLGSTDDLTAVGQVFAKDGVMHYTAKCFIPEKAFNNVPKHVRQVYDAGRASGTLVVTEGEVADHDTIREYIESLAKSYDLKEVAFDAYTAVHLTSKLQEFGLELVKFPQNIGSMSPASKETELLTRNGTLKHLDDPFLAWQLSNCEIYTDVNENIKVRKGADRALKIDAIIAGIMAVGRATSLGAMKKPKVFDFYLG